MHGLVVHDILILLMRRGRGPVLGVEIEELKKFWIIDVILSCVDRRKIETTLNQDTPAPHPSKRNSRVPFCLVQTTCPPRKRLRK
jgi:hypothetical protein